MAEITFADPDVTTLCRLDGFGLRVVGQHVQPERAVLECVVAERDDWCHRRPGRLARNPKLGRTLHKRAEDVLAYFDRPHSSNGPTEGINGRLEHLRGIALGFRNLTHYIARALLETGGLRPQLHPAL